MVSRNWILPALLALGACSNAIPKSFDKAKPPFDIPAESHAFELKLKQGFWKLEDELTVSERQFADSARQTLRNKEKEQAETTAGDDWRKDRQARQDVVRKLKQDLRQQARIKREEMELATTRFVAEQEADLKKFTIELEAKLKTYEGQDGFQNAQSIWNDLKSDLRDVISKGRERLRLIRPRTELLD